jgi:uncharacterized protein (TIGR02996 family)
MTDVSRASGGMAGRKVSIRLARVDMSDELFLRAVLASSGDTATRLVYADRLEERGDPR